MSENNLPAEWKKANLPAIATLNMGQSPSSNDVNQTGEGIAFFQGKAEFGKLYPSVRKYCTSPKKLAKPNDILLSVRAPVGPTNLANQETAIGRGLAAISVSNDTFNYKFLLYYFRNIEPWMSEQGTGTTFRAISGKFLKDLRCIVPPLAEQKVIADKLDTLLVQVETIKARLDSIPQILKTFRQSVLTSAVSGKLTEEWRENKGYSGWGDIKLEKLITASANGLSKRSGKDGAETTILRLADFKDASRIYGKERKIKLNAKETEKYSLINDDILIIRVNGSIDLAGKFIRYEKADETEGFCDHFIRLRLDENKVLAKYIIYVANEGSGRSYLQSSLSTSAGQNTINQVSVKGLDVPLPSIKEQTEIVRRVEELFAFADRIEQKANAALERVNNLTQSILAKAFRGELTTDWRDANPDLISGDNSAEALLAKIKAEREAKIPKRKVKATKVKG
ncbi:restriction endonuclease subunit S [Glaciecola sp. SC05]|uniref:restriction endonuclease subunit S n=1 Tax=Glaciecola sp. SC05 TaxID=1987355 RepID=UPI0035294834